MVDPCCWVQQRRRRRLGGGGPGGDGRRRPRRRRRWWRGRPAGARGWRCWTRRGRPPTTEATSAVHLWWRRRIQGTGPRRVRSGCGLQRRFLFCCCHLIHGFHPPPLGHESHHREDVHMDTQDALFFLGVSVCLCVCFVGEGCPGGTASRGWRWRRMGTHTHLDPGTVPCVCGGMAVLKQSRTISCTYGGEDCRGVV